MAKAQFTQYKKIDCSMSLTQANIISVLLFIPILLIPFVLYAWIWGPAAIGTSLDVFFGRPLWFLLGFLLLVVLHEGIHGLTWQVLSGASREAIEYGIKWKVLTPYAHLKEPIELQPYRWGTAMPGLVLGVLPALLGLIIGSELLFLIGLFMTAAASGDMIILYLLRNEKPPALVEDHPENAGCFVLVAD
jgi:hypothetical protein